MKVTLLSVLGLLPLTLLAEPGVKTVFKDPLFSVVVTSNLVYGTGEVGLPQPGKKNLLLDLYAPAGPASPRKRPGFVAIHGGGFRAGNKSAARMMEFCRDLASRGYACVSINYRLEGDDPQTRGETAQMRAVRAAIEDARKAVRWVIANAETYGIDTNRVAIGGSSAGACTALGVAYLENDRGVRAVVDMWGTMGRFVETIEAGEPPVIIIHGTEDPTVKFADAKAVMERARKTGVPFEFCPIEGAAHGVSLKQDFEGIALKNRIANFLYQHLDLANSR